MDNRNKSSANGSGDFDLKNMEKSPLRAIG